MKRSFFFATICMWYLLPANTTFAYTRQDSLRGGNGSGRNWWNVQHYELSIVIDTATKSIKGHNNMLVTVTGQPGDSMQIDLQEPMIVDSIKSPWGGQNLHFSREGNVWWVRFPKEEYAELPMVKQTGAQPVRLLFDIYYHGQPRIARLPPWEGGFVWTKDSTGKPWVAVACQGLGASSWWPCKDAQWDEPDEGMDMEFSIPLPMKIVSNGQCTGGFWFLDTMQMQSIGATPGSVDYAAWRWKVKNPINNYSATFYSGDYIRWTDTLMGEKGRLDLSFYALRYNEEKARKQFAVVKQMLHCFEYWLGPYPFYEDGYKLVESPYLGMEHQSAVAYGNEYKMGYRGIDRSASGVGNLFDFIIVHESGHEWFGNSITAGDIADNWLHEGFTTYTEALFAECAFGKEKAFEYTRGEWFNIRNDRPVIGDYGVNDDGSGDKYDKGSAVVHMIRMMLHDDEKFRQLLRALNKAYYHKTVSSADVENFIIQFTGLPLKPFFDQYLRTKDIPQIDWYIKKKKLYYRFKNTVPGFTLPLQVEEGRNKASISPTSEWQSVGWKKGGYNLSFSKDFLVQG